MNEVYMGAGERDLTELSCLLSTGGMWNYTETSYDKEKDESIIKIRKE